MNKTINSCNSISTYSNCEDIAAKAKGYSFRLYEKTWQLDKNTTVNLSWIHTFLEGETLRGCLLTLAFYAANLSASHTLNNAARLQHFLRETGAKEITEIALINYRASLNRLTEWYLGTIRGFLRKWHSLGYPGVEDNIVELLNQWRIKGNRKGDAVKRKDPSQGPLTDFELQAFNEGAVRSYEKDLISIRELAIALVISHTGRRPIQISHLRVGDILTGKNNKGEPFYILNVPRGKNGKDFRSELKPFAITQELWAILSAHAKNTVQLLEQKIGFELQKTDQQQVPLFCDFKAAATINTPQGFRDVVSSDRLHITAAEITDILQFVADCSDIKSERTGEQLFVNARRFRYTTGTRAAREGFGELVIAELLDHQDTQNAGIYVKNIPEHVEKLDEAVGFQLAPFAQAFAGILVDSERDALRGDDPTSRIRSGRGTGIGTCGEHGFCGANVPIPCYTCMHFQPWVNGPHQEVYQELLSERERINQVTGDLEIAAILDRSIVAVADIIQRCEVRKSELNAKGSLCNG